jgi:hypothetical protein
MAIFNRFLYVYQRVLGNPFNRKETLNRQLLYTVDEYGQHESEKLTHVRGGFPVFCGTPSHHP